MSNVTILFDSCILWCYPLQPLKTCQAKDELPVYEVEHLEVDEVIISQHVTFDEYGAWTEWKVSMGFEVF